jgi:hypothetical protein
MDTKLRSGGQKGSKFDIKTTMKKKKETLWDLLKRLDEEAGQYNFYMHEANRYFDNSALATKKMLDKHEKKMHKLIAKVQKALKSFYKQEKKTKKKS